MRRNVDAMMARASGFVFFPQSNIIRFINGSIGDHMNLMDSDESGKPVGRFMCLRFFLYVYTIQVHILDDSWFLL